MSEADEDDELLDDDLGETTITRFTENPYCKSIIYSETPHSEYPSNSDLVSSPIHNNYVL